MSIVLWLWRCNRCGALYDKTPSQQTTDPYCTHCHVPLEWLGGYKIGG